MKKTIGYLALAFTLIGAALTAQSKESPRSLHGEGSLSAGSVSVYYTYGHVLFGKLVCQPTYTGQTVIFTSSVRSGQDFAMNAEFMRQIVQIADEEYAKAPCVAD